MSHSQVTVVFPSDVQWKPRENVSNGRRHRDAAVVESLRRSGQLPSFVCGGDYCPKNTASFGLAMLKILENT